MRFPVGRILVAGMIQGGFLSKEDRGELIALARSSVIGDIVSPGTHVGRDVLALLAFAWEGKFLLGALRGFVAT